MINHHIPDEQLVTLATEQQGTQSTPIDTHLEMCIECTKTIAHIRTIRDILQNDLYERPSIIAIARAQNIFRHQSKAILPRLALPQFCNRIENFLSRLRAFLY